MSEDCNHDFQNTGLVFCTIPESPMQVCTKCGEQRLHQQDLGEEEKTEVELKCDICQNSMTMVKQNSSAIFKCADPNCDQTWQFTKDGDREISSSCTILGALWPSGMKEDSKMFREEYIPHLHKGWKFSATAKLLAGFITEEERETKFQEFEEVVQKWFDEHPIKEAPIKTTPKWKFWIKE